MYIPIKDLPATLTRALKGLGYNKREIEVRGSLTYRVAGVSGDGSQAFATAVDMVSGRTETTMGAWGGASFLDARQADVDDTAYPLPLNGAVIKGSKGQHIYAYILVHPDALPKLLPSGTEEELSEKEIKALVIIDGTKSSYRRDSFFEARLGSYAPTNPLIVSLAAKGLLKLTATGISVTTEGKNVRAAHPEVKTW